MRLLQKTRLRELVKQLFGANMRRGLKAVLTFKLIKVEQLQEGMLLRD